MKNWYPEKPPLYDIRKSYTWNLENGPIFSGEIPKRPPGGKRVDFLGFSLRSPLGVPAGPLLGSKWVKLAARLGFDLPVYKTIRSFAHPSHMLPNMMFVETDLKRARTLKGMPQDLAHLSVTNSFGMPSQPPDFLLQDIAQALDYLEDGQELVVSIVGTPNRGVSFADDFVRAALLAKEAGAKIIEANFSCPNVGKTEGCLYTSPETVEHFASKIAAAIHPIPLIIKVGLFPNEPLLKDALIAAARAGVRAVCGLNSVSMEVVDAEDNAAMGPSRPTSGICGAAIRSKALEFIRTASSINQKEKLELTLMGCGGIMEPQHFDEFLKAGALTAMSATGMMWDPYLAMKWHERQK